MIAGTRKARHTLDYKKFPSDFQKYYSGKDVPLRLVLLFKREGLHP